MVNQTMQQNQYYRILSGESRPFPGIYEAISEQLLLLIFKARQLYQAPEYRPWFEEQHQVYSLHCVLIQSSGEYLQNKEEYKNQLLLLAHLHCPNPLILILQMRFMLCAIYTMVLMKEISA